MPDSQAGSTDHRLSSSVNQMHMKSHQRLHRQLRGSILEDPLIHPHWRWQCFWRLERKELCRIICWNQDRQKGRSQYTVTVEIPTGQILETEQYGVSSMPCLLKMMYEYLRLLWFQTEFPPCKHCLQIMPRTKWKRAKECLLQSCNFTLQKTIDHVLRSRHVLNTRVGYKGTWQHVYRTNMESISMRQRKLTGILP